MKLFSPKTSITPPETAAGLGARQLVLVDIRQPDELTAGRVDGAINIPLWQLGSRLPELDGDHQVAFLCHTGARSTRATGIALRAGYDAVNVRGGMNAWNRAGLPLSGGRRDEVRV